MKLNEAVSIRLSELLAERNMTQYKLFTRCGVSKSSINNIINQNFNTMYLKILWEICQGLDITLGEFFNSPLFDTENLDP